MVSDEYGEKCDIVV